MEYELDDILKILEDNLSDYHKEVVNAYITALLVKIEGNNEEINKLLDETNDLLLQKHKVLSYIAEVWKYTKISTQTIVAIRTIERLLEGSDKE